VDGGNLHLPWAGVKISIFALNGGHISHVEVGLGLVTKRVGVAQVAIDVVVWPLSTHLVIQGSLAISAGETLTVIQATFGGHFLRFKDLRVRNK
jgi:hypothetical protein